MLHHVNDGTFLLTRHQGRTSQTYYNLTLPVPPTDDMGVPRTQGNQRVMRKVDPSSQYPDTERRELLMYTWKREYFVIIRLSLGVLNVIGLTEGVDESVFSDQIYGYFLLCEDPLMSLLGISLHFCFTKFFFLINTDSFRSFQKSKILVNSVWRILSNKSSLRLFNFF